MDTIRSLRNITVYRNNLEFCGWPFNGGFWDFGDGELVLGFIRSECTYGAGVSLNHTDLDARAGEHITIRSIDGGRTWPVDSVSTVYRRPEFDLTVKRAPEGSTPRWEPRPMTRDFCLLSGFGIPADDAPSTMFIMCSYDRARTWTDPVRFTGLGFTFIGGRPSYVVRPDGTLLLYAHGGREEGVGRSVPIVFGSDDGGTSWGLIGEIEPAPMMPTCIMPYPLVTRDGRILVAVRRQYPGHAYTQVYESRDGGQTHRLLSRVNDWGAPASIDELPDGRIVTVYGYRRPPYGVRARVSRDGGASWGNELVLRDDGGSSDLGYPRTRVLADGSILTAYYFNDRTDPIQRSGGVRYIAATEFRLD